MRKLVKLFYFILLIFVISCTSSRIPTDILKVIEMEDNNLCIMEGVEFKYKSERMTYWQCRLRIIDQRIVGEFNNYGYSLLYQREFKKVKRIIKNRMKEERNISLAEINNSLEEKEHNYCIMLKNKSEKNTVKVYNYFECRENLEKIRVGKNNFSDLNNEYLIKLFEYRDEIESPANSVIIVEKECIKYAGNEEKLKNCKEAINKINQCSSNITRQLEERRTDDKIFCAKMSIEKYPDELSKFSQEENNNINSFGPKMDNFNILDLRKKEFIECYKTRGVKIPAYKDHLENQCKIDNLKLLE